VLTTTGIVCTAWRVGPQNRIFTAEHCIANQADVSAAEVWFNFEANQCGGNATGALVKVSGATLLAVNETLDFALFTVSGFESLSDFGYLGLEVRQAIQGERIYIPQHGYGQPKQLAFSSDMNPSGLCEIDDTDHDGYGSRTDVGYYCDTVSSSSGAPVISAGTGRAIALHHLGGCVNSGAKMSLIWPLVAQHFGNVIPAGDREPTLQNRPPEASIRLACLGLDCRISGTGSRDTDGTVVDYRWDFGDGKTGTGENVQHRYPAAGSYRIKLAVTDDRGAIAETTQSIRIGAATRPPPLVIKPGR
jgi:hypothetical protein